MENLDSYSYSYCDPTWTEVSLSRFVRTIRKHVPNISESMIISILDRYSVDFRVFDFEMSDWIKYFQDKGYEN